MAPIEPYFDKKKIIGLVVISISLHLIFWVLIAIYVFSDYTLRGNYTGLSFCSLTFVITIWTLFRIYRSEGIFRQIWISFSRRYLVPRELNTSLSIFVVSYWNSGFLSRVKFILFSLQAPGLILQFFIIAALSLLMLFGFLGSDCVTQYVSLSNRRSITVKDYCWLDCNHRVYLNQFILEKSVGRFDIGEEGFCAHKDNAIIRWSEDETKIEWQIDRRQGILELN